MVHNQGVITIPTVLVLGAGASYPYGFPTAKELKKRICEEFSNPNTAASRLLGEGASYSPEDFFNFKEAFLKSGQPSVDAFLEWRPNFLDIGKLAIAYCLIPFEDESKLFIPPSLRGGDWYEYLSVKLNASFEDFGNNKLAIITFNYDRSLEHYLHTSLQNLHGRNQDDCNATLAKIPIIHVYGQLGKSAYSNSGAFPYGLRREVKYADVHLAAAGITLLHEQASELNEAHKLFTAAERICFLGFSYNPLNLARLLPTALWTGVADIGAPAYVITGKRNNSANRRFIKGSILIQS
jgi:hypothetical protein